VIAGYLLYSQRGSLPAAHRTSIGGAVVLVGIGLAALAAGIAWRSSVSVNDDHALMATAFVSFVAAGGYLFQGSRWMAAAAFPVSFLIFMIPLPDAARVLARNGFQTRLRRGRRPVLQHRWDDARAPRHGVRTARNSGLR